MSSLGISKYFLEKFAGSYGFAHVVGYLFSRFFIDKFSGSYGFGDVALSHFYLFVSEKLRDPMDMFMS